MADKKQNLVGPSVRRLRTEAQLSQEKLVAKLQLASWDLSRGGLSKIEAGLRRVNDAELWMLAKALGCTPDALYPARPKNVLDVVRHGKAQ